jgi:hypothetical protein
MKDVSVQSQSTQLAAQPSESATMLQMIQNMASNPACDMDKLERLMQLKERMDAKTAETEFNEALSRVQGNMGRVSADATNSQTRSQYATYGKLDKAVRPIYTAEGFSLSFSTEEASEGMVGMVCYVSHRGGHTREYRAAVPSDGKGAKGGDVMTKTHAFGSGTSYGMRYLLKMIFNIAIGEEDDDGNAATGQDLRDAALNDLISRVNESADQEQLTKVWQSGVTVLKAARDHDGYEQLKAAVAAKGKKLEASHAAN